MSVLLKRFFVRLVLIGSASRYTLKEACKLTGEKAKNTNVHLSFLYTVKPGKKCLCAREDGNRGNRSLSSNIFLHLINYIP